MSNPFRRFCHPSRVIPAKPGGGFGWLTTTLPLNGSRMFSYGHVSRNDYIVVQGQAKNKDKRMISDMWYFSWPGCFNAWGPIQFDAPKSVKQVRKHIREVYRGGRRLPRGTECWPTNERAQAKLSHHMREWARQDPGL